MDINSLIEDLNPQQRRAVTAPAGQTLVLAGPGSGKTRVLTFRVAYLVLGEGVRPWNILAVTFTNKAAREMGARLEKLLGEESARRLWLGTFHAECARILRIQKEYLPFQENFVIFDADDQLVVVKRAIRDLNIDEKLFRPGAMLAAISDAKNRLVTADQYPSEKYRDEVVRRVYQQYQKLLVASNALDFDDLLLYTVRLFDEHPYVRDQFADRFHHVLVDEFQDTNLAQYRLLEHLSSVHHNLFVVGDEDQAIYRWRGADYRNVLRFEKDFPACQKILLEQNYRSTQIVLDAARAVIDRNRNRTPKKLFTDRGQGEPIKLHEAADDHAEAEYVVDTISRLTGGGKTGGGGLAVMYRTNAQSRLLEEAFLRAGLPYRLVGAQRFYGRREVKDLIAYLRLVHNPADEVSLERVINVPPRKIGDAKLKALRLAAVQARTTPGAVLLDLGRSGPDSPFWRTFSEASARDLMNFGILLNSWREQMGGLTLPALFDRIVSDILYQAYIDDNTDEGADRWENVQELRRLTFEYTERGLVTFLETLALVSDQDTLPEKVDAPTLLTLHAAKGLEFDQVFIIGLDEGLLPHSRSVDDPEEMAEERRLFYVGLTRARNHLYLVRADRRTTYGSYEDNLPSRFLGDIPPALLQSFGRRRYSEDQGSSWGRRSRWQTDTRWDDPARSAPAPTPASSRWTAPEPVMRPPASPVVQKYQPNQRVRHPVWGDGLVVDSKMLDSEEVVDVHFESVGFKRLLAALAKLEILP